MNKMDKRIEERIGEIPISKIPSNGEVFEGREVRYLNIIVKVHINVFESNFLNGDICHVIAETLNNKLIVKRLEDGHMGIVDKQQVSYAQWEKYPF